MLDSKSGNLNSLRNKYLSQLSAVRQIPEIPLRSQTSLDFLSRELATNRSQDHQVPSDRSPRPNGTISSARGTKTGKICKNTAQPYESVVNTHRDRKMDEFWSGKKNYISESKTINTPDQKIKTSSKKVSFLIGDFSIQNREKKPSWYPKLDMGRVGRQTGKRELDSLRCIENVQQIQKKIKNIFLAN